MNACGDDATLQRFLLGSLPEDELALLEEHLQLCSHCVETLARVRVEDALFDAVRHASTGADASTDGEIVATLTRHALRLQPNSGEDVEAQIRAVAERL